MSNIDRREGGEVIRDERGVKSDTRVFRNIVCGTTPSLGSSTSPIFLRFFSVSVSELTRDAKLRHVCKFSAAKNLVFVFQP